MNKAKPNAKKPSKNIDGKSESNLNKKSSDGNLSRGLFVIASILVGTLLWKNIFSSKNKPQKENAEISDKEIDPLANKPEKKNSKKIINSNGPTVKNTKNEIVISPTRVAENSIKVISDENIDPLQKEPKQKNERIISFDVFQGFAIAQGDILLGKVQEKVAHGHAEIPLTSKWPSSTIYYHIQPQVANPQRILQALQYLSEKTVLQFVPYTDQPEALGDALVFEPLSEHCLSYVGRIGGLQPIFISAECEWTQVAHEILHAVGLVHEHGRPDRDTFVKIMWPNIPEKFKSQFEILPEDLTKEWMSYAYDVKSIMHYPSQNFLSEGGHPSILDIEGRAIPEPSGLSEMDAQKVNRLFGM